MDLEKILRHDVRDHLIDHFTLEMIMTMNMVAKNIPDLTKHHKIKDIFFNNFSQDSNFFQKFRENDKLISCICEYKIIIWKDFINKDVTYKLLSYYSRGQYNVEKIILAIINNDVSYIFFCLFVNRCDWFETMKLSSVIGLLHKYNLYRQYENFIKQFSTVDDVSYKYLDYPWLTLSLIINNYDMIKNILNLYNTCEHYVNTNGLGGSHTIRNMALLDDPDRIYEYIVAYYPGLKQSFDLIKINERKMMPVVSTARWHM